MKLLNNFIDNGHTIIYCDCPCSAENPRTVTIGDETYPVLEIENNFSFSGVERVMARVDTNLLFDTGINVIFS